MIRPIFRTRCDPAENLRSPGHPVQAWTATPLPVAADSLRLKSYRQNGCTSESGSPPGNTPSALGAASRDTNRFNSGAVVVLPQRCPQKQQRGHREETGADCIIGLPGHVFKPYMADSNPIIDNQQAKAREVEQVAQQNRAGNIQKPSGDRDAFEIAENQCHVTHGQCARMPSQPGAMDMPKSGENIAELRCRRCKANERGERSQCGPNFLEQEIRRCPETGLAAAAPAA